MCHPHLLGLKFGEELCAWSFPFLEGKTAECQQQDLGGENPIL